MSPFKKGLQLLNFNLTTPGECPPQSSGIKSCTTSCNSDSNCPNNEKCCSNGCGRYCTAPYKGVFESSCFHDGQCPATQKCCPTTCGHVAVFTQLLSGVSAFVEILLPETQTPLDRHNLGTYWYIFTQNTTLCHGDLMLVMTLKSVNSCTYAAAVFCTFCKLCAFLSSHGGSSDGQE
uniref:WAP domain-containing protein n=1 Tax=Sinocyclocheilus anshuiensis TaxID=1608454 RepID=A0A671QN71_9TELE